MKKERSQRNQSTSGEPVIESTVRQAARRRGGSMKRILHKNQIVITALVILVAAAGYLEMTRQETEGILEESVETGGQTLLDLSAEELGADEDAPGEALLVNATGTGIFASVKLDREQTRARNRENLQEIIGNDSISEQEKSDAIASMVALTASSELENATELLLQANGFTDVVVSIVDQSADIVVATEGLSQEQAAQIMDIVKRKTEFAPADIVITPVDPSGT